jgi:hypothetical protein
MAVEAHDVPSLRLGAFIGEVTFLPADSPRDAALALWRPAPGFVSHGRVRLWTAGSHGVTAEELEAGLAPVSARLIRAWQAHGSGQGTGVERSPAPTNVEQL